MSSLNFYLCGHGIAENYLPDEYRLEDKRLNVAASFVISRSSSGAILSCYRDDIWDFSPYFPNCYCTLNFNTWREGWRESDFLFCQIRAEMKEIIFALLHIKPDAPIIKSIRLRHGVLRWLAVFAYENGCSLRQLFHDTAYINKLQEKYSELNLSAAVSLKNFLRDCYVIQQENPDLISAFTNYQPISQLDKIIRRLYAKTEKTGTRTKLIPSRIYTNLINGLSDRLNEFNHYAPALFKWFERIDQDKTFALMPREFRNYSHAVSFADAQELLGLTEFFERNNIKKHANLTRYITLVQGIAKLWIHLFTGMRDNEVNQLSYGCHQIVKSNEHNIHVLVGYTSKLHGAGNQSTYWITFEDIRLGVEAAQRIGELYTFFNQNYDLSNLEEYPLFPSRYSQKYRLKNNPNVKSGTDFISHFEGAPVRTQVNFNMYCADIAALFDNDLRIREDDIAELEAFDGFRNWREEKDCQLGKHWNICTHQFRRSLAVYGARSGIIGLGVLSVQFKHLTEAMTLYYRENAVFAPNILANDSQKEFIQELEYQRLVHSYAQFEEGVINSSSRLLGGAGTYLQMQQKRGELLKVFPNRDETIKRMKKGEIAYKPSLFGACTNPDPCEKVLFTAISSCLNCAHAVFDTSSAHKMQKAVQRMQHELGSYAADSLVHKQKSVEIEALNKVIQKIKTVNLEA